MTRDVYNQSGLSGASYVGALQAFTGEGAGIYVLSAAVLDTVAGVGFVNESALIGPTLAAGSFIPGKFTSVGVNSGLIAIPNLKSGNTVA